MNLALAERAGKERRLRALGGAIAAYEAQFGLITPEEMTAQARADRGAARVVRAALGRAGKTRRTRRGAA